MSSQICGVYGIVHRASGRAYVGSSKDVATRWRRHIRRLALGDHHATDLQFFWNCDGPEAFTFVILERCHVEDLALVEQGWIDAFEAPLNATRVAQNPMLDPIGREIHRIALASNEYRQKMRAALLGVKRSNETRAKLRAVQLNAEVATARNLRMHTDNPMFHPEVRAKFSASRMRHIVSVETRAKISATKRGHKYGPMTENHRAKISATKKAQRRLRQNVFA